MIAALILVRTDSSRLPQKALKLLGGKRLIEWPMDALKDSNLIKPILTTTKYSVDDELIKIAEEKRIDYFRGDRDDVAKRIIDCCEAFDIEYFFRINGDSPFVNLPLIHQAIDLLKNQKVDIVSNLFQRTYPYGMAIELINVQTFKTIYNSLDKDQKEHITNYYYKNLKEINFTACPLLHQDFSSLQWTVDTNDDLLRLNEYLLKTELKSLHLKPVIEVIMNYIKVMNVKPND